MITKSQSIVDARCYDAKFYCATVMTSIFLPSYRLGKGEGEVSSTTIGVGTLCTRSNKGASQRVDRGLIAQADRDSDANLTKWRLTCTSSSGNISEKISSSVGSPLMGVGTI